MHLEFIRPGRSIQNSYIESFNGRLRDECVNVQQFFSLEDAREKLEGRRQDYNHCRPHSSLGDFAPPAFALGATDHRFAPASRRGRRGGGKYSHGRN